MPHENEEENKDTRPTGSLLNIVAWWRRFHFSGRVIMCSVLLGLGLILIGGLIFAINVDDDSSKSNSDDIPRQPTKAPSHYTGPVVMGIGGFIVVTGVIMCLFETQVCRRRTGDSSPLIAERTEDPENKGSDQASVPSTSHSHKSHRRGARKASPSPKKSKSRHVKSQSKERNGRKSPSPRSPPVTIEPSKSFMTSSEDKFITPPNTLDRNATLVQNDNSRESDDKDSGLMKSFTSSDPSWNQSAEFLTPSTSFRDLPATLNNNEEVDKHQDAVNLKATEFSAKQHTQLEYITPLTVEEDRFQQVLIRVKNEQKEMADAKRKSMEIPENSGSDSYLSSSEVQGEIINKDNEVSIKVENEDNPTQELLSETLPVSSASKGGNKEQTIQVGNAHDVNQKKYETNVSEGSLKVVINEALNDEISEEAVNATEGSLKVVNNEALNDGISEEAVNATEGSLKAVNNDALNDEISEEAVIATEGSLKVVNNEALNDEISEVAVNSTEGRNILPYDDQQGKISSSNESPLPTYENEDHNLATCSDKETSDDKVEGEEEKQVDLESSNSSAETIVSPDSFQENTINNGPSTEKTTSLNIKGNSTDENECFNNLKSSGNDTATTNNDDVDHLNNQINIPNSDEAGTSDLNLSKTNNIEVVALGMENVSKDGSS